MEGLKILSPIILLSIILPTWDVFSDLRIIIMIFMEEYSNPHVCGSGGKLLNPWNHLLEGVMSISIVITTNSIALFGNSVGMVQRQRERISACYIPKLVPFTKILEPCY